MEPTHQDLCYEGAAEEPATDSVVFMYVLIEAESVIQLHILLLLCKVKNFNFVAIPTAPATPPSWV